MRVLGIDPGVAQTGWAVLETGPQPSGSGLVASGLLKTSPRQPLPQRLEFLHSSLGALITEYKPETIAIEELFFMKAARSVAATSYARAVILLAAAQAGSPVAEYNPRAVKTSLTGNGNAPKLQMQRMVQALLNLNRPPKPDDVADAMAIGLCHLKYARFNKAIVRED
jgi:crossover junction endodeoxyribonuclease RuvC